MNKRQNIISKISVTIEPFYFDNGIVNNKIETVIEIAGLPDKLISQKLMLTDDFISVLDLYMEYMKEDLKREIKKYDLLKVAK